MRVDDVVFHFVGDDFGPEDLLGSVVLSEHEMTLRIRDEHRRDLYVIVGIGPAAGGKEEISRRAS
jgi:hypothetical protein